MNMILISEIAHPGEVHIEVNRSLIEIISHINPADQIVYRAETEQVKAVSTFIQPSRQIKFISFEKYYDPKSFNWSARVLGEIKQIYRSLKVGKELNTQTYVWTCLFSTGQFFLNFYLLFFNKRNVKHLIVLHGELEFLKPTNRKRSEMFLGVILKLAIIISLKSTKYIVLGDRIRDHLKMYLPDRIIKRIVPILHPYKYNLNDQFVEFHNNLKPIVFGAIGTQMLKKNSHSIFYLANSLEEEIANDNISFVTIGKVLPEISPFVNKSVNQIYPNSFVPQVLFENETKKLNFVLFFYDNHSYQLCASGAVFEVIKMGLPIISIYNDYFDWLFQKYGQMGFLCNNIDEIKDVIRNIVEGRLDDEINTMLKTIMNFKIQNRLEVIAADLVSKL